MEYPDLNQEHIRNFVQELEAVTHELDLSRYISLRICDLARDIPMPPLSNVVICPGAHSRTHEL